LATICCGAMPCSFLLIAYPSMFIIHVYGYYDSRWWCLIVYSSCIGCFFLG
jgi:hypothetical protein